MKVPLYCFIFHFDRTLRRIDKKEKNRAWEYKEQASNEEIYCSGQLEWDSIDRTTKCEPIYIYVVMVDMHKSLGR